MLGEWESKGIFCDDNSESAAVWQLDNFHIKQRPFTALLENKDRVQDGNEMKELSFFSSLNCQIEFWDSNTVMRSYLEEADYSYKVSGSTMQGQSWKIGCTFCC